MDDLKQVRIEKIVYGGDGLARLEGQALFVPYTAAGDLAEVAIEERKPDYCRGRLVQLTEGGADRRDAPCRHFRTCGGCQLQHMAYPAQIAAKQSILRELLHRTLPHAELPEIDFISSPEFGYRRSVRLQVSKDRPAAIGFYRPQSHDVVDIQQCPLLMDELNCAYGRFRQYRPLEGLSNMRIGGIRAVYGRDDHVTVFSILDKPASRQHAAAVLGCCQDDGEILSRLNPRQPQHVHDTVSDLKFRIHPLGFFQSNVFLAEILVRSICQVAESARNCGNAVELYCGNGLFTLPLAGMFRRVVAVEQDRQSVTDGVANAHANGIGNIQWICDAVDRWITVSAGYRQPDFVLVDPPREGLSKTVSRWVLQTLPRRVAYVSCSPPTLARDLKRWVTEGTYRISSIVGMDLFPQTYHIETLVVLERVA